MIGPAWETRQLLFVYGSLLLPVGDAGVDAAMASGRILGAGTMPGLLYDLGDYPGAVAAAPAGRGPGEEAPAVRGRLVGFPDPDPAFAVLDWYEGHGPGAPHAGEFVRALAEVSLDGTGERIRSQVYLFALPVAGRARILSGDYLAFRRDRQGTRP